VYLDEAGGAVVVGGWVQPEASLPQAVAFALEGALVEVNVHAVRRPLPLNQQAGLMSWVELSNILYTLPIYFNFIL